MIFKTLNRLYISLLFVFVTSDVFSQGLIPGIAQRYIPEIDHSYTALKFEWNLSGKMQAFMNDGLTNLDEGKFIHASKAFSDATIQMPLYAPAWYYLAISQRLQGNYHEAKKNFLKALEIQPEAAEIHFELGKLHHITRRVFEAKEEYEKSIQYNPLLVEAYFHLGNIELMEGNSRKAYQLYEKCSINPSYSSGYLRMAVHKFLVEEKKNASLKYLDNALIADSTSRDALFWRGLVHLSQKNKEKCLKDWNKLIRFDPENAMLLFMRAVVYIDIENFDNAFSDFRKAVSGRYEDENKFKGAQSFIDKRLDLQFAFSYITRTAYGLSDKALHHLKKGFCLLIVERREEAIDEFRKSLRLETSAVSTFLTGLAYEHSGKHDSAFVYYDKTLLLDNDNFDAHKKRGIYRSELNDWRGAYSDFDEMVRIDPSLIVTYKLRSQVRMQFNDYYGTVIDLTKFLKKDTTDVDVWLMRGFSFEKVEDYKNANYDYLQALKLDSSKFNTFELLALSFLQLKDTTQCFSVIKACEAKHGLNTRLFIVKNRILISKNNFETANNLLNGVLDQKSGFDFPQTDQSILFYLQGLINLKQSNFHEALVKVNKAISLDKNNKEALYLRSKVNIQLGDISSAAQDLRILIESNYADSQKLLSSIIK